MKTIDINFDLIKPGEFEKVFKEFLTNNTPDTTFIKSIYKCLPEITNEPNINMFTILATKEKMLGLGIHLGLILARFREQECKKDLTIN